MSAITEHTLAKELASLGFDARACDWQALTGGRTNHVWRVVGPDIDVICKLYRSNTDNPLFPNIPDAEALCLSWLQGSALAPDLIGSFETSLGSVAIYGFTVGETWRKDVTLVADILGRLHVQEPPSGLRQMVVGDAGITADTVRILSLCSGSVVQHLKDLQPDIQLTPPVKQVLLHGDVVPENILVTSTGAVLIDWQCPGVGDPLDDIACFLSPTMQIIYGGRALTEDEIQLFLSTYQDKTVSQRYREARGLFHWRMAAYALWRSQTGAEEYQVALTAELKALEVVQ